MWRCAQREVGLRTAGGAHGQAAACLSKQATRTLPGQTSGQEPDSLVSRLLLGGFRAHCRLSDPSSEKRWPRGMAGGSVLHLPLVMQPSQAPGPPDLSHLHCLVQ